MKILVSDQLASEGVEILKGIPGANVVVKTGLSEDELCKEVADADALVIRSGTTVTEKILKAAQKLQIVGRAGIGVDNVDVPAATARGVIVANTPTGNIVTTAEHAIALLFSLARQVPQATASMKDGKWEKKKFKGYELTGKTIGVIGLGNIGKIVANRAQGLQMKVIGYDPFVTAEKARELGIELVDLDGLFTRADIITCHTPLNEHTRGIVGKDAFGKMKKGVLVVNAARGGIVDEDALLEALNNGKVAGAALDVFVEEPTPKDHPLVNHENVVCTPHLGAATYEAQLNVAVQVAELIRDYLTKGEIRNAVNMPGIPADQAELLRPYMTLGEKLGKFQGQMHPGGFDTVEIDYIGDVAELAIKPVTLAVLKGLLESVVDPGTVNYVNAPSIAEQHGLHVRETKTTETHDYAAAIRLRTSRKDGESSSVEGAVYAKNDARIVAVGDYRVEVIPEGVLLALSNKDEPGVIGHVGTILAKHKVNIASMNLGRNKAGGKAISFLSIDEEAPEEAIRDIASSPNMLSVKQIRL